MHYQSAGFDGKTHRTWQKTVKLNKLKIISHELTSKY